MKPLSWRDRMAAIEQATPPDAYQPEPGRLELLLVVAGVDQPKLTAEHVAALGERSSVAVGRVLQRILALSGLTLDGPAGLLTEALWS